ncbi:MAG: Hydantoinase/oxoprolinase [Methanomassiliicoccales archaeon PtaU1.Bin124]|nr:MAG: Hydantoinase/oxoprolinase [Methanomassiliicoccales archaeon PtaU1.Bin124]
MFMARKIGLGIDTGGTFTDAALVDLDTNELIAKGKSPTTYDDLAVGIIGSIDNVLEKITLDRSDIRLIGISTTLATNSLLQGRGGEVGLIGIGWKPEASWNFGVKHARYIKGGFDSLGRLVQSIDEAELQDAIDEVSQGTDAIAVSGFFSVCNGWQEINVKTAVNKATSLPVIMGQMFTSDLGIYERTVTAVLNAKLLTVIDDFLNGVERAVRERGIEGKIYVFKGDGGLMSMATAREKPVEMVISGPAASLMGGKTLAQLEDAIVVDIGGTSTDIAFLDSGFPRLNQQGAIVGEWRTRVKGIDIWTCGLGGDSRVWLDDHKGLRLGPDRVLPLAVGAARYPSLLTKMAQEEELNFYVPARTNVNRPTPKEAAIMGFIEKNAPCSYYDVLKGLEDNFVILKENIEALKDKGHLLETGLTPTDALHHQGRLQLGDPEASKAGMSLLCKKAGEEPDGLAQHIVDLVITRIGEEVVKKALVDAGGDLPNSTGFELLLRASSGANVVPGLNVKVDLGKTIVGIGAPAKEFVLPLRERMTGGVVIPPGHDVGNAVGAVCSQVTEMFTVQISPQDEERVMVFSPMSSPSQYRKLEEAISSARTYAERMVRERIEKEDVEDVKVRIDLIEKKFPDGYGKEMKFVNWIDVRAVAMGKPRTERPAYPTPRGNWESSGRKS